MFKKFRVWSILWTLTIRDWWYSGKLSVLPFTHCEIKYVSFSIKPDSLYGIHYYSNWLIINLVCNICPTHLIWYRSTCKLDNTYYSVITVETLPVFHYIKLNVSYKQSKVQAHSTISPDSTICRDGLSSSDEPAEVYSGWRVLASVRGRSFLNGHERSPFLGINTKHIYSDNCAKARDHHIEWVFEHHLPLWKFLVSRALAILNTPLCLT